MNTTVCISSWDCCSYQLYETQSFPTMVIRHSDHFSLLNCYVISNYIVLMYRYYYICYCCYIYMYILNPYFLYLMHDLTMILAYKMASILILYRSVTFNCTSEISLWLKWYSLCTSYSFVSLTCSMYIYTIFFFTSSTVVLCIYVYIQITYKEFIYNLKTYFNSTDATPWFLCSIHRVIFITVVLTFMEYGLVLFVLRFFFSLTFLQIYKAQLVT